MFQQTNTHKSARIWIKHRNMVNHLSDEVNPPADDLRSRLIESIVDLCDEKFYGCEFAETDHVGYDIKQLLT